MTPHSLDLHVLYPRQHTSVSPLQLYVESATCGDIDGIGSGTVAFECPTGLVAKTDASLFPLGSVTKASQAEETCCVAQVRGLGPTMYVR